MKALNPLVISGREVLPLVEGGKGISVSNGESSGAWAAAGGVGTFSGVNADSYTEAGTPIAQIYYGRTRRERHEELVAYAIAGGIQQARVAYERANGEGRIHMNVLWEMAAAERVLHGVLEGAKGLIHGVTCGAGMPYKIAEICAHYGVHYYPIHLYDTCYGTQSELPVAEKEMKRIMSLPIYPDMTDDDVTRVSELVKKFYAAAKG